MNQNENLYNSYMNKQSFNHLKNNHFVNSLKYEKTEPSTIKNVDDI